MLGIFTMLYLGSDNAITHVIIIVWWSQTHVARRARGGYGDIAIPNLFWRNVEVVSASPPLYLNFYHKLAMIAKPSIDRVADTYRNFYLWLRRVIPSNLLTVIDRCNICVATQIWYAP